MGPEPQQEPPGTPHGARPRRGRGRAVAVARQDPLHHGALVGRVLVDLDDAQLARAALNDLRVAARDHGRDHAGLAEQHEALAVPHIEALELLAAVGVPDAAVGEHAVHVHRHQTDGGQSRPGGRTLHAWRPARSRSTTNGSAITLRVTSSTSVSPKLYSKRPATRKAVTAASAPTTSARSATASPGTRRSKPHARAKKAAKIQSQSARPTRPRSTAICSGVLCRWLVCRRTASGGA